MEDMHPHSPGTDTPAAPREPRSPMWAQLLSDVCSPILIPTYATTLAMWVTPLRAVPEKHRVIACVMIFVMTGLLPLLCIALLIKLGMVSDRAVSNRRQRFIPMSVAAVCYIGAGVFMGTLGAPWWMRMFFYGAGLATIIDCIISFWWKISAHTTSVGGLAGMMLWFALTGIADVNSMIMLSVGIVLCGAMCTARLLLRRHTMAQTIAGLCVGFICVFVLMFIN